MIKRKCLKKTERFFGRQKPFFKKSFFVPSEFLREGGEEPKVKGRFSPHWAASPKVRIYESKHLVTCLKGKITPQNSQFARKNPWKREPILSCWFFVTNFQGQSSLLVLKGKPVVSHFLEAKPARKTHQSPYFTGR